THGEAESCGCNGCDDEIFRVRQGIGGAHLRRHDWNFYDQRRCRRRNPEKRSRHRPRGPQNHQGGAHRARLRFQLRKESGQRVNPDGLETLEVPSIGRCAMEKPNKDLVVDADAHVVESARTWEFMDASEKQFQPIPLETREEAGVKLQFWLIDGKVRGLRFPAFSAAELEQLAQRTGRKFEDNQESREMGNVDLRLAYMDRNNVDVQ